MKNAHPNCVSYSVPFWQNYCVLLESESAVLAVTLDASNKNHHVHCSRCSTGLHKNRTKCHRGTGGELVKERRATDTLNNKIKRVVHIIWLKRYILDMTRTQWKVPVRFDHNNRKRHLQNYNHAHVKWSSNLFETIFWCQKWANKPFHIITATRCVCVQFCCCWWFFCLL